MRTADLTFELACKERDEWWVKRQERRERVLQAWEDEGQPDPPQFHDGGDFLDDWGKAFYWSLDYPDLVKATLDAKTCLGWAAAWQQVAEMLCPGHEWDRPDESARVCVNCGGSTDGA